MCEATSNAYLFLRHQAEIEAATLNAELDEDFTHADAVAQLQTDFPALGYEFLNSLVDPDE